MRRQVEARGTSVWLAPALWLVLSVCAPLALGGCNTSLSTEFANLESQKLEAAKETPPPSRLTPADSRPLSRAADKLSSGGTPGNTGYKIGPFDVVEFSVFKVPELTRTAQVAETGTVNLPLVGEVQAAGRTAHEVERELADELGKNYLQSPQVTILVKEYNSQRVTVEGAVKRPGVYPIRGKTSLLQIIATAEGLDTLSDTTVVVFRQIEGKRAAARFDVSQIRSGASTDPPVQSGDVIVAPTSAMKGTF